MTDHIDFIGVFVAIRGDVPREHIRLTTERLMDLASIQPWRRLAYDPRVGKQVQTAFSARNLDEALDKIENGALLTLFLMPTADPSRWAEDYSGAATFHAMFQFEHAQPLGRRSPLPPGCAYLLTFPVRLFHRTSESSFQRELLARLAELFEERNFSYAYVNRGRRDRRPLSIGEDDVFFQTRSSIPVSSFDPSTMVLLEDLYEDHLRSAFWANFLNPRHVASLGGARSLASVPHHTLTSLPNGGAVMLLAPSPLYDAPDAAMTYQAFRESVRPIRIETVPEWNQVSVRARAGL